MLPSKYLLPILIYLKIRFRFVGAQWKFPNDFKFGVATSAYQIEGGWDADGKGVNIWDEATHKTPDFVLDKTNADVACDSYNKWKEDVQMIKNLGVDFYRFSLSWSRILPTGFTNEINQAGVDYYNKLINELLKNGIEPVITLYHWDLPQIFVPLGTWTNPLMVDIFANYARLTFTLFGDRVKTWITFNEPRLICQLHKANVIFIPPIFPHGIVEYACSHNLLKAHAEAYHIYNREFKLKQGGRISLTLDFVWSEPASNSPEDIKAAEQRRELEFGIYANPILNFGYPQVLIDRIAHRSKLEGFAESRLPKFTLAEKLRIRGTYDFLGLNHYITVYTKAVDEPPVGRPNLEIDAGGFTYADPAWVGSGADWVKLVPWGLRRILQHIKTRYRNPEVVITEIGYPDKSGTLDDVERINYFKEYLNATLQAIYEDRVNVKSFTAWSLMDNYEWDFGYSLKFGLYHVDFTTPNRTRTPKKSVDYIRKVVTTRLID